LAKFIADLQPKFVRFPGGCLAHGDGIDNMYRWKDTIGPIEQRKQLHNIWHYHQSLGLGYYEYFQFCEDIGAKPLPVVPAGVCCQNSGNRFSGRWGEGQAGLPMNEMDDYVQEVLDLVEWANGPTTSTWGAKRAAQGHPAPFNLEYLGVGNEDAISDLFRERFELINDALREKHPEITVIGTTGPDPSGPDYDAGWKLATELNLDVVDEHGYKPPQWYFDHLDRFDGYDRGKAKVYLGEYAAHEIDRANTLRSALAEAAYMTSLERNGDVVHLASYAPLLARHGHTQWNPNLIYFTGTSVLRTANYYVQQMFGCNQGDVYYPGVVSFSPADAGSSLFAISCVKDSKTGDVILKMVNASGTPVEARIDLSPLGYIQPIATRTVLSGDPTAVNTFEHPNIIAPITNSISVSQMLILESEPFSLDVIRMSTAK